MTKISDAIIHDHKELKEYYQNIKNANDEDTQLFGGINLCGNCQDIVLVRNSSSIPLLKNISNREIMRWPRKTVKNIK
jgi:hypothetical protein